MNILRKLRIAVAVVLTAILTFGFLDIAGVIDNPLLQKIQFGPALMSLSVVTLAVIIVVTFLFGRIYCSTVCPLGIFQDFVDWIARKADKRKKYGFRPERKWLRIGVLAALVLAWALGFTFLVGVLEPYSAFGRIANELFKPVYLACNNVFAAVSEKTGSYRFFRVAISIRSVAAFVTAVLTFLLITYLAYFHGRTWCNTICPVGTILGLISRKPVFGVRIDLDKCNHCTACGRKCKAFCIDSANQKIDYSRCVDCFDCLDACRQGALSFGPLKRKTSAVSELHPGSGVSASVSGVSASNSGVSASSSGVSASSSGVSASSSDGVSTPDSLVSKSVDSKIGPVQIEAEGTSRRDFLKSSLVLAAIVPQAVQAKVSGGAVTKRVPMSPPGSVSHANLLQHCTSCHLCVSKCPSHVLVPAGLEYGIGGIMQPVMKFDQGYCNYDCNLCSQVCPDGAIKPITVEQKHRTQPGRVVLDLDRCVVQLNHTSCGACAEHCPVQAIHMVPFSGGQSNMASFSGDHTNAASFSDDQSNAASSSDDQSNPASFSGNHPNEASFSDGQTNAASLSGDQPNEASFFGGLTIPETTPELCVGCGGCEFICPNKAVHIEGNPVHQEAQQPAQDQNIQTEDLDFGF